MSVNVSELLEGHRDAITVRRVFGDPIERNGVTVIPAAMVAGAGGGGQGEDPSGGGSGSGSGFGLAGRPAGAYVIRGDDVSWQPAVDVNRIVTGALSLAGLALLVLARRSR